MERLSLPTLLAELRAAGVPAGEVRTVRQAFESDVAKLREIVVSTSAKEIGEFRSVRSPLRMSASSPPEPTNPPELGEDTNLILREQLDYSLEQIEDLRSSGVVA